MGFVLEIIEILIKVIAFFEEADFINNTCSASCSFYFFKEMF